MLLAAITVLGAFRATGVADEKPAEKITTAPATTKPALSAKAIKAKLLSRTDLDVKDVSLAEVVERLAKQHEVPIRLDPAGLKKAEVTADKKITFSVKNFTLNATLKHLLIGSQLHHIIDAEGAIVITFRDQAPAQNVARKEVADKIEFAAVAPNRLQEKQYLTQFRPLARAELHLIDQLCDPTPEQRRLLATEGASALTATAKQCAQAMQNMQNGRRQARRASPRPRELIQAGFAVAVQAHLTPAQADRYREETAKREANRRRVTVRGVVMRVDRHLGLSATQREALCKSLAEHWDESWEIALETGWQFVPQIADAAVTPVLNPAQLAIWKAVPKVSGANFFSFRGGIFQLGIRLNDVRPGEEDDLDRALKELAEKEPDGAEPPREAK
jgi:hypothetical protein